MKAKKPADTTKPKVHEGANPKEESGDASTTEHPSPTLEDEEEPEEVMMIDPTWMQPYLA
jgi:hypothetical protein